MSREPALLFMLLGAILLVASGLQEQRSAANRAFGWAAAACFGIAFWCALVFALDHQLPNRPIHSVCYEDGSCASDGK